MDHRYGLNRQRSGLWRTFTDGDFEEEDVWGVLNDRKDSGSKSDKSSMESTVSVPRSLPTAARMIPRATSSGNSSGNNFSSHEARVVQQSAPVHIPNWSKVCRKSKKASRNASLDDDDDDDDDEDEDEDEDGVGNDGGDSDDENGRIAKLPPHEFISRRLAKSQISSFSVFEGIGRTLKGRDLSKVRNVVLTKTGFLEAL